ncbi:MAG: hypothetical protein K2J11_10745 [Oscillospiraceae bacterium]|nr:hypothetical protein [Oscillospiraceae bacterium]
MLRDAKRRGGRVRPSSKRLSPFLTACSVSDEKDFAACGRRPKGSALWTSASWAQLDQL